MIQKRPKNRVDYRYSIIEGIKAAWPRPQSGLGSREPGLERERRGRPKSQLYNY